MHLLDGSEAGAKLERIARAAAPLEAVGLLTEDGQVIELPNRSGSPENSFEVTKYDIMSAITKHEVVDVARLALWHSHPNGGVGPSTTDMQQRLPFFVHFVVTLKETDVVFTWY